MLSTYLYDNYDYICPIKLQQLLKINCSLYKKLQSEEDRNKMPYFRVMLKYDGMQNQLKGCNALCKSFGAKALFQTWQWFNNFVF